ncbi:hypothetical protein FACS189490_14010 [Clostridia bacterium]|nr:hypothetical protein FACS189490_14010 [Clostridia bacterium]
MSKEHILFSQRLAEARHKAGLTQQQLADKVGVTVTVVSRHERLREGAALPEGATVRGYAAELGVSADWLFGLSRVSVWVDKSDRLTPEAMAEFLFHVALLSETLPFDKITSNERINGCLRSVKELTVNLGQDEARRLMIPTLTDAIRQS